MADIEVTMYGPDARASLAFARRAEAAEAAVTAAAGPTLEAIDDARIAAIGDVNTAGAAQVGLAAAQVALATTQRVQAEAAALPLTALTTAYFTETTRIPGAVAYRVDEYYCPAEIAYADGSRQTFADVTATLNVTGDLTISRQVVDATGATYVYAEVDEYYCPRVLIDLNGNDLAAPAVLTSIPAAVDVLPAYADLGKTRPDGVTRVAIGGWTGIITYGESTSVATPTSGSTVSTAQPYSNLTFTGGPSPQTYGAGYTDGNKPLVEDTGKETQCSGLANMVSEYALKKYGILPSTMPIFAAAAGKGAQTIDQLSKSPSGGANGNWARLLVYVNAMKTQATAAGKTLIIPCVPLFDGANDEAAGTSYATFKALAKQIAIDIDADIRAITGQTVPVATLLYQTSGSVSAGAAIKAIWQAQIDAALESPLIHYVGNWQDVEAKTPWDGFHLSTVGGFRSGLKAGIAVGQFLFEGRTRMAVPISATAQGGTLTVRFDEPVTIDRTTLGATTTDGLTVYDGTGPVPISNVRTSNGLLLIDLGRALGTNPKLTIAWTVKASGAPLNTFTSSIRALDSDTYKLGGTAYTAYRWAPHGEFQIINLEH